MGLRQGTHKRLRCARLSLQAVEALGTMLWGISLPCFRWHRRGTKDPKVGPLLVAESLSAESRHSTAAIGPGMARHGSAFCLDVSSPPRLAGFARRISRFSRLLQWHPRSTELGMSTPFHYEHLG